MNKLISTSVALLFGTILLFKNVLLATTPFVVGSSLITETAPSYNLKEGEKCEHEVSMRPGWREEKLAKFKSGIEAFLSGNEADLDYVEVGDPWFGDIHTSPSLITHALNSAIHDEGSTTHLLNSDIHFVETDTHNEHTDLHTPDSITHLLSSDYHYPPSDTHYENSDYHYIGSDTHFVSSDTHESNSNIHSSSSSTIQEDDLDDNCVSFRADTGHVTLGRTNISSWNAASLYEVLAMTVAIKTYDSPEFQDLKGNLVIEQVGGDIGIVEFKSDRTGGTANVVSPPYYSLGSPIEVDINTNHDGCGVHNHEYPAYVALIPVKAGTATFKITFDPDPSPAGDGLPANEEIFTVTVPDLITHEIQYTAFIRCEVVKSSFLLLPLGWLYGVTGDDRNFGYDLGVNFAGSNVLGSRGAIEAEVTLKEPPIGGFNTYIESEKRMWGTSIGNFDPLSTSGPLFCDSAIVGSLEYALANAVTFDNMRITDELGDYVDFEFPNHPGIRIEGFRIFLSEKDAILPPATPNLDAEFELIIRECAGNTRYMLFYEHDWFPWHSLYLDGKRIYRFASPVDAPQFFDYPWNLPLKRDFLAPYLLTQKLEGTSGPSWRSVSSQ